VHSVKIAGAPNNYVNGQNCPCLKNAIFNCGKPSSVDSYGRTSSAKSHGRRFFHEIVQKKVLPLLLFSTAQEPSSLS